MRRGDFPGQITGLRLLRQQGLTETDCLVRRPGAIQVSGQCRRLFELVAFRAPLRDRVNPLFQPAGGARCVDRDRQQGLGTAGPLQPLATKREGPFSLVGGQQRLGIPPGHDGVVGPNLAGPLGNADRLGGASQPSQ